MYTATCSQCKSKFKSKSRTMLLSKLGKHLWKQHRAWMIKRIKAGRAGSGDNPAVLRMFRDFATGDFIPGYKEYKRKQYVQLKPTLDAIAKYMPLNAQIAWKFVDTMADKIFK